MFSSFSLSFTQVFSIDMPREGTTYVKDSLHLIQTYISFHKYIKPTSLPNTINRMRCIAVRGDG